MTPADTARAMGLALGDTICGSQDWEGGWHEAELTLIWLGSEICVWQFRTRSHRRPEWSGYHESATWNLRQREWVKV